jgi:tight junction protein 1
LTLSDVPDLPPRIDRASKPPPSTPGSSLPSRNSSSVNSTGTLGRSAQERLFGNKSLTGDDQQDDLYTATNKLLNTLEPKKMPSIGSNGNSLERRDMIHNHHHHMQQNQQNSLDRPNGGQKNGSSYDSVSSYDSYNTNQAQQAITTSTSSLQNRLGPNAPDDLKSVPGVNRSSIANSQDYATNLPRNSMHERDYSFNGNSSMHDPMAAPRNGGNLPQRPTNLLIESPRKPQTMETKTDYGKYR